MQILVLDDSPLSASHLLDHLRQLEQGHTVIAGAWPDYDPELLEEANFILLHLQNNLNLDDVNRLRRATKLPILLIAPIEDEETLVLIYAGGVDDHLIQPLSYPLLDAKLRVWQRWIERLASMLYH